MPGESRDRAQYNKRYQSEKTKCVNVRFYPGDMELYEFVSTFDNKAGYIKDLIRADMEKSLESSAKSL